MSLSLCTFAIKAVFICGLCLLLIPAYQLFGQLKLGFCGFYLSLVSGEDPFFQVSAYLAEVGKHG